MRAIIQNSAGAALIVAFGLATMAGGLWAFQATAPRPRDAAADILARRPLFGQAWLTLANEDFRANGHLSDAGRAAFARAHDLTPNEGQLMFERALLGLPAWTTLTLDLKGAVASDIAGVITYLPDPRPLQLRLMVAGMPAEDRTQLRAALLSRGVPEPRLAGIGL